METNEELRKQIFEIVEKQIKNNDPPETNIAFNRLVKMGYSDFETKQLLGQCVAVEIFNIMKHGIKFDDKRYINNLKQLPNEPIE